MILALTRLLVVENKKAHRTCGLMEQLPATDSLRTLCLLPTPEIKLVFMEIRNIALGCGGVPKATRPQPKPLGLRAYEGTCTSVSPTTVEDLI